MHTIATMTTTETGSETIERLEREGRAAGLTVPEMCRVVGVGRSTWQRWKRGQYSIRVDQRNALDAAIAQRRAERSECAA